MILNHLNYESNDLVMTAIEVENMFVMLVFVEIFGVEILSECVKIMRI
jgi:hypothetical protein